MLAGPGLGGWGCRGASAARRARCAAVGGAGGVAGRGPEPNGRRSIIWHPRAVLHPQHGRLQPGGLPAGFDSGAPPGRKPGDPGGSLYLVTCPNGAGDEIRGDCVGPRPARPAEASTSRPSSTRLILGRHDRAGHLHGIGRTVPLRPDSARRVAEYLTPGAPGHQWTGVRFAWPGAHARSTRPWSAPSWSRRSAPTPLGGPRPHPGRLRLGRVGRPRALRDIGSRTLAPTVCVHENGEAPSPGSKPRPVPRPGHRIAFGVVSSGLSRAARTKDNTRLSPIRFRTLSRRAGCAISSKHAVMPRCPPPRPSHATSAPSPRSHRFPRRAARSAPHPRRPAQCEDARRTAASPPHQPSGTTPHAPHQTGGRPTARGPGDMKTGCRLGPETSGASHYLCGSPSQWVAACWNASGSAWWSAHATMPSGRTNTAVSPRSLCTNPAA